MEQEKNTQEQTTPPFRGLYKHVKISVRTLDIIIVSCILVIIVTTAMGLKNAGFPVTFDSRGGTDVTMQKVQHGEYLPEPEPPTREGYVFSGWYKDPSYDMQWDFSSDRVEGELTLYARWQPAG